MKLLTLICLFFSFAILPRAYGQKNYIVVKPGDVASLLEAIDYANHHNIDSAASRFFVFIPNGTYDLGDRVLTPIWGHNIAVVGESMEGTVIVNAPSVEHEGISTTATILNRGHNTYVQDLTLKNNLDYYHSGPAGRAVCWQDKGNKVIFKRVRMLSYQDTYYSHSEECMHYFEDSEIHGTVDFICGAGDVYFNRCLIFTEKRNSDGSGVNVIAAPRTSTTQWGYVFNHCTIRNDMSEFGLARAWHSTPRCVWLYTRLETPEKLMPTRYDPMGLRTAYVKFYEYGTTDANGHNITPPTNVVPFEAKEEHANLETIITKKEAERYTVKNVFPKWRPDKKTRHLEKLATKLKKKVF